MLFFFCFCFCQNNWIEIERCVARVRKCCQCSHLLVSFTVLIKEKEAFHWKEEKSVITTIDDDLISGESSTQGAVFNLRLRVRHLPVKSQQNVPVSPKKYLNHTFLYAASVLGIKKKSCCLTIISGILGKVLRLHHQHTNFDYIFLP